MDSQANYIHNGHGYQYVRSIVYAVRTGQARLCMDNDVEPSVGYRDSSCFRYGKGCHESFEIMDHLPQEISIILTMKSGH